MPPTAAEERTAQTIAIARLCRLVVSLDRKIDTLLDIARRIERAIVTTLIVRLGTSMEKHGAQIVAAVLVGIAAIIYVSGAVAVSLAYGIPLALFPSFAGVL